MSDHYRKLAEECDRAETALRTQVDRNVVVHLRARQADIYERALRKIIDAYGASQHELITHALAVDAIVRAEKLK